MDRLFRLARRGRGRVRLAAAAWVVPIACFWVSPLLAQPTVRLECKDLSPEDSARVETRLLASLLSGDAADVNVTIACDGGLTAVSATVGAPEVRRTVALSGMVISAEAILALAARAVTQLLAPSEVEVRPAAAAPADKPLAESGVATSPNGQPATRARASGASELVDPAPDVAAGKRPQAPVAGADHVRKESRVRADIALQSWGSQAATGAALGLEQASGSWTYAFLAGGARPLHQPSLSAVTEWTAAGEFGWQGGGPLGIRVSTRLGLSLLVLDVNNGVATSSGTIKSAGFLELDFSRPIWLGRFGVAPGVGVRAFSAKRAVTSEGQAELQLSTPSAHALLTMLFRASE